MGTRRFLEGAAVSSSARHAANRCYDTFCKMRRHACDVLTTCSLQQRLHHSLGAHRLTLRILKAGTQAGVENGPDTCLSGEKRASLNQNCRAWQLQR